MYCTQSEWWTFNGQFKEWYFDQYPFLLDFDLPIPHGELKKFHIEDMEKRNLEPQTAFVNCYELSFSYFLENFPRQDDPTRFRGKTFLEMTIKNLPSALAKSPLGIFEGVGNIATGISDFTKTIGELFKKFYIVIIPLIIYLIIKNR